MWRAFQTGLSGIRNHQLRLDVIGSNIANINTVGFKASRTLFEDMFSTSLASASHVAGSNQAALEIGNGARVRGVEALFTQGTLEETGRPLDLSIVGDALFMLRDGGRVVYSRAGNFEIDPTGRLVLGGTHYVLQGATAGSDGTLGAGIGDIVIDPGARAPAEATSELAISGNLDAAATAGTERAMTVSVHDPAGNSHALRFTFTKSGDGSWTWTAGGPGDLIAAGTSGRVTFDADGNLAGFTYDQGGGGIQLTPSGAPAFSVHLAAADGGRLTAHAGPSTTAMIAADGRAAADLVGLAVDGDGLIQGIYGNGATIPAGRIALATIANPAGLARIEGNAYAETPASGRATAGFMDAAAGQAIAAGTLERSNVDLSTQFADMITTQRGFQANARAMTVADDMLALLTSLLR